MQTILFKYEITFSPLDLLKATIKVYILSTILFLSGTNIRARRRNYSNLQRARNKKATAEPSERTTANRNALIASGFQNLLARMVGSSEKKAKKTSKCALSLSTFSTRKHRNTLCTQCVD
jgi:hypothetical protein